MRQPQPTTRLRARPSQAPRHAMRGRAGWHAKLWPALLAACLSLFTLPGAAAPLEPDLEAFQAFEQASAEIRNRRFERAEILLERVLMLQPEHAEARIELALLMAGRGHQDGALALLQSLIDDPRTEPEQALELKNLMVYIRQGGAGSPDRSPYAIRPPVRLTQAPSSVAAAIWRGEVNMGWSSNPMARTAAQSITITLPDGPLSLPLTQSGHAGAIAGTSLSRVTDNGGIELAVQGANVSGANTASRAVAWARLPMAAWLGSDRLPAVLAFAQAQRGLDGQHRAQAGLTAVSGQQKYTLSNYREYSVQDQGFIWRAEHDQPRLWGIDWYASIEHSQSTDGPKAYWRAALTAEHPLGEQAKLTVQFSNQNDTYVYSSLLENGARRHLMTLHVAYEQRQVIDHEKNVIWRVFTGERRSNLSLFGYRETGLQLSLVRKWP